MLRELLIVQHLLLYFQKLTSVNYMTLLIIGEWQKHLAVSTFLDKHVINFPADTSTSDDFTYINAFLNVQFQMHTSYTSGTLDETWTDVSDADRICGCRIFFSTDNELYLTGVQLDDFLYHLKRNVIKKMSKICTSSSRWFWSKCCI